MPLEGFGAKAKKSIHGDEYYSPQNVVDMIVPYIDKNRFKRIWCPFDTEESLYVKTFRGLGFDVVFGHIETGQDFFSYSQPQGDIIVSNPPYSKRNEVLQKVYEWDIPFALVLNLYGLFDSRARGDLFRKNGVEILVPIGRMKFIYEGTQLKKSPTMQSVYVCNKLVGKPLVLTNDVF